MAELDDTDAEILRLLLDDGRRSYTEIGEKVGLSSPTVSTRIDRLEEIGVIQGFTVDVDRSKLTSGDSVILDVETRPGHTDAVVESLAGVDSIECILQAFEPRVTVHAILDDRELEVLFDDVLDSERLRGYEVRKVANTMWNPRVDEGDLALECAQCGKPIHGDGVSVTVEERRYYLCCPSCESLFREEYETLRDGR